MVPSSSKTCDVYYDEQTAFSDDQLVNPRSAAHFFVSITFRNRKSPQYCIISFMKATANILEISPSTSLEFYRYRRMIAYVVVVSAV
jgi:hypothetical protein